MSADWRSQPWAAEWKPGAPAVPKPAINHPSANIKLPPPGLRPRGLVEASRPDCHLCSWVAAGSGFRLKMVNTSCTRHGELGVPWDAVAWREGSA